MKMQLYQGRPADMTGRQDKEKRVYELLDRLGIAYERVDHEAAETMEACEEIDKFLAPAVICKNLFLCNTQKTKFYLLMIRGDKKFKTKEISSQIHSARLSFAPAEKMEEYLDILPGSVSVLGLMNDNVGCHPCVNTSSLRLKTSDIFNTFLKEVSHDYITVVLSE